MVSVYFYLALLLPVVSAHFSITYPYWRGDSFATQYTRPCGGVNVTTNRTEWPLDGGSLSFGAGHPWAITYVNLALGDDETITFNISLIEGFNQTGKGDVCFSKLSIPESLGIADGTNASLQVIQLGELGSSLYNCADITFKKDAKILENDQCKNSSTIGWEQLGSSTTSNPPPSTTDDESAASQTGGAAIFAPGSIAALGFSTMLIATLMGLAF
ncbi:hypothetical protein AJ80_05005 [Polytolypa hystricis UAMH7299]|uniref:Copper acquisition factor BIM1-like domain-containing protein n=1 Tax=Polytolypa hystricis (strain UAMH7299) TaxID=1447883 RepID=A0A2B7Y8J6_POLH7|nr:hypothetical protein AJ80_05005 [Polytolypa hystricis UAMH7299]